MKQVRKSIIEACHGQIKEKADYALEQILANINDINTDDKKARKLTITLTFKPQNERQEIKVSCDTKTTLAPTKPVETTLFNFMRENPQTGEVFNVLQEVTGQATGQIDFDGNIVEPEVFVFGVDAERLELENKQND